MLHQDQKFKKLESNDCTTKNIKVKNESTPIFHYFFDYEDVKQKNRIRDFIKMMCFFSLFCYKVHYTILNGKLVTQLI